MQRVSNVHRVGGSRGRSWLAATVLAALVVLVAALPAAAVAGSTKLVDPAVSPTAATPTTTITFAVTYRNREGSPPDEVVVDPAAWSKHGRCFARATCTCHRGGV